MLNKVMQCTCCQLALGLVCQAAPSRHKHALQHADLPVESMTANHSKS